jgi:hypothetical protein
MGPMRNNFGRIKKPSANQTAFIIGTFCVAFIHPDSSSSLFSSMLNLLIVYITAITHSFSLGDCEEARSYFYLSFVGDEYQKRAQVSLPIHDSSI